MLDDPRVIEHGRPESIFSERGLGNGKMFDFPIDSSHASNRMSFTSGDPTSAGTLAANATPLTSEEQE